MIGVKVIGLDKAIENISVKVNKVKLDTMIEIDRRLIRVTPVLTGRARSNWTATVDAPTDRTIFNDVASNKRRIARGGAPLSRPRMHNPRGIWPKLTEKRNRWKTLWLSNKLDYIEGLNDGTIRTSKAGKRFVQAAVRRGMRRGVRGLR